jgi:16S rRNA (uracil1498-N3)-methyltransferase
VERDDLATLAGFFSDGTGLVSAGTVRLGEDAAHHMRVRRLEVGDRVFLADGAGTQATGVITAIAKREAEVRVAEVAASPRPPAIHLLVPISDRDRMLWLAEKGTELGVGTWRPVMWRRSRSVSPRGEGSAFAARVNSRMRSALLQSHAPWLPLLHDDSSPEAALAKLPSGGSRLVLDTSGDLIASTSLQAPVTVAVGPEGGLEPDELRMLMDHGFHRVSLGANVLRFETAAIAALAIVASMLHASESTGRIDG